MVDVGANIGYFTLIWVAIKSDNMCIAFEPSPNVYRLLEENIKLNSLKDRVTIYKAGVGNINGELLFDAGPDEPTGWGHLVNSEYNVGNIMRIPILKLDDIISHDEKIDFLKVDVEGAELLVFQGAEDLLKRKAIKYIYFEQNVPGAQVMGFEGNGARKYLESVGYNVRFLWRSERKAISDCWAVPA